MTRTELFEMVKEEVERVTGAKMSKKASKELTESIFEKIFKGVKGDGEVVLPKLGKLKIAETKERSGVSKGVKWKKPAGRTIRLRLSKRAKEEL